MGLTHVSAWIGNGYYRVLKEKY